MSTARIRQVCLAFCTARPSSARDQHQRARATSSFFAAAWLAPRLGRVSKLPPRLLHGDWTPLNVLIDADGTAGILDFEACVRGPAVFDFANVCSTMLMWSDFDRADHKARDLASALERRFEAAGETGIVPIALVAHWFTQCCEWQNRARTPEDFDVVQRLLRRVDATLSFAETCGVP